MTVAVEQLITPEINRPARYLGNEQGTKHKPWDSAIVRWVLIYPEIYEVGASNLGHVILYNVLNAQPRQLCDRCFFPKHSIAPYLFSPFGLNAIAAPLPKHSIAPYLSYQFR